MWEEMQEESKLPPLLTCLVKLSPPGRDRLFHRVPFVLYLNYTCLNTLQNRYQDDTQGCVLYDIIELYIREPLHTSALALGFK